MGAEQIELDRLVFNLLLIVAGIMVISFMALAIVKKVKTVRRGPPFVRQDFPYGTRFTVYFDNNIYTSIGTDIDIKYADSFLINIYGKRKSIYISSRDVMEII